MLINALELEKIIKILFEKYVDYQEIRLVDVKVSIDQYLKIVMHVKYYTVDTKVRCIARFRNEENIIVDTKGTIKYGFINFDFNKLLQEYVTEHEDFIVNDDNIIIRHKLLKSININNQYVEIELN